MFNQFKKPAPRWYRILNSIWGPTETFVIAMIMVFNPTNINDILLVIKLSSSFIRSMLDTVLVSQAEDYTPNVSLPINPNELPKQN